MTTTVAATNNALLSTVEAPPFSAGACKRYINVVEIARGGFGRVFKATDSALKNTPVAIKLSEGSIACKLAAREAAILKSMPEHEGVVAILDSHMCEKTLRHVIVMAFVTGEELFYLLNRDGAQGADVTNWCVPQLLSAVRHVHSCGILHGDIKLENIMVDTHRKRACLIDFGFASCVDEPIKVRGTLAYLAPEYAAHITSSMAVDMAGVSKQMMSDARATDVWSVGICVYAMLLGNYPFEVANASMCARYKAVERADSLFDAMLLLDYRVHDSTELWPTELQEPEVKVARMALCVSCVVRPSAAELYAEAYGVKA